MNLHALPRSPRTQAQVRRELCDTCILLAECQQKVVTYVGSDTVRIPEVRLGYQNYLAGLRMPYSAQIDWIIHAIRDFDGRYCDEDGTIVPTPGFATLLQPATEFWFRDQISSGPWKSVHDVPRLRREAIGRWRLIGTTIAIKETVFPRC